MIKMIGIARRFHGFGVTIKAREEFEVRNEEIAAHLEQIGAARRLGSYEATPSPFNLQTKPAPSASSPAAPASRPEPSSSAGKGQPSPSTTPTDSPLGLQSSTPATGDGGNATSSESAPLSPAKPGRKTRRRRAATDSSGSTENPGLASDESPG